MLIVEDLLIHSLELSIAQYKTDLENKGNQVEVNNEPNVSSFPVEISNLQQQGYAKDKQFNKTNKYLHESNKIVYFKSV